MKLSLGKKVAGLAVAGTVLAGAGTMAWADNTGERIGGTPRRARRQAPARPKSAKAAAKASGKGLALLTSGRPRRRGGQGQGHAPQPRPGRRSPSIGARRVTWPPITSPWPVPTASR